MFSSPLSNKISFKVDTHLAFYLIYITLHLVVSKCSITVELVNEKYVIGVSLLKQSVSLPF